MNVALLLLIYVGFDPPLGMNSRELIDGRILATSTESAIYKASYGRLLLSIGGGGWCASLQNTEQYLEITLKTQQGSSFLVTAVATQGVLSKNSWVKSYYFSYSMISAPSWIYYHDHNEKKVNVLSHTCTITVFHYKSLNKLQSCEQRFCLIEHLTSQEIYLQLAKLEK